MSFAPALLERTRANGSILSLTGSQKKNCCVLIRCILRRHNKHSLTGLTLHMTSPLIFVRGYVGKYRYYHLRSLQWDQHPAYQVATDAQIKIRQH